VPLIPLVICRDGKASRKDRPDRAATDCAAAALAVSTRAGARPDAWVVLARNLIPVLGIYGFGWPAALTVFNYWFDGLTALAAIIAALIPRALRETQPKSVGATLVKKLVRGAVTWIFLVGIIGLPYWIELIPLHDLLLGNELRRQLAHSPALWLTSGSLAAGHFWKAFH
jgi:hypothetical protein